MLVAAKRVSDRSETIFQFSIRSMMEQDAVQSNNKCLLPTFEPHTDMDLILCGVTWLYIYNDVILSTVNNTYSPRLHILGCTTLGFPLQTAQTSVIICILIRYQYRWLSDWLPSLSSLLMFLQAFTYQRGFVWKGGIPQPTGWSDSSLRLTILRVCPIFRHTHINLSWISPVYSH